MQLEFLARLVPPGKRYCIQVCDTISTHIHTIVSQLVLHRIKAIYFKKVSIFLSIQGPLGKMGKEGRKGGIGPKGTPGEVGAAGLRGPKV